MNSNQIIEKLNSNDYNADQSGRYVFVTRPFGDDRPITKFEIVVMLDYEVKESSITISEDGLRILI